MGVSCIGQWYVRTLRPVRALISCYRSAKSLCDRNSFHPCHRLEVAGAPKTISDDWRPYLMYWTGLPEPWTTLLVHGTHGRSDCQTLAVNYYGATLAGVWASRAPLDRSVSGDSRITRCDGAS